MKPRVSRTVGHKLTPDEKERLQQMANGQSRSLSAQITFMLRNQLRLIDEQEAINTESAT